MYCPWSKAWRPRNAVGQEDRGGKCCEKVHKLPTLLQKSCPAKISVLPFTIFLLENKVWVSQGKSDVTFPATTFLEDPIFHLGALIKYIFLNNQLPLPYRRDIHRRAFAIIDSGSVGFIFMSSSPDLHRSHQCPWTQEGFSPICSPVRLLQRQSPEATVSICFSVHTTSNQR